MCCLSLIYEQTPPTRHSDHFVHHFYGDVHSDRLCGRSDHQSHFWQGLVNILDQPYALALVIWFLPSLQPLSKRRLLQNLVASGIPINMSGLSFWASMLFYTSKDLASDHGCSSWPFKGWIWLLGLRLHPDQPPHSSWRSQVNHTVNWSHRQFWYLRLSCSEQGFWGSFHALIPTSNFFYWLVLNALIVPLPALPTSWLSPWNPVHLKQSTRSKQEVRLQPWSYPLGYSKSLPLLDTSYPHAGSS